ncbi:hypothetical protein [Crenothrix polyspora]|uniref:Uncharacterized protein n=1 Tax=Crenothrix polyspora TaxID=360316 RepID=A0A1R4HAD2_9GAMM|nr:hypothetical protein [Crenothrix polyspora]SJM93173.1 conserved hypothetical protein [Crenothrix polyspora]
MALSEQQKQKKLLKKKQKKSAVVQAIKSFMSVSAVSCADYPLYESVVANSLFELGIGEVVIARRLPNGQLAASIFIVDVFCLGVKNTFFRVASNDEYEYLKQKATSDGRHFVSIHQSCARKLLEGAVEYAKNLGFSSHPDYKKMAALFGAIDASACPVAYEYGKDNKPYYIRGPNESVAEAKKIVDKLYEKCGEGGYNFLIMTDENPFD